MSQCSSGENLVFLASAAAVSLSRDLSKDDLIRLSNFITTLASDPALIAVQRELPKADEIDFLAKP